MGWGRDSEFRIREEREPMSFKNRLKSKWAIGTYTALALMMTLRSCSCVPAGHVRVVDAFGSVSNNFLTSGVNFPVKPWAKRPALDLRTQQIEEKMDVPTKEGLIATLDVSILYRLEPDSAVKMYKTVGTGYDEVIITPNLRNAVRDAVATFSSEDLYSENRQRIAAEIVTRLSPTYQHRGINLESVLLRNVSLPEQVKNAIETKMRIKQEAEQMEYTLQKERQEAERKRVEARGIADAQEIIAGSLTTPYLQWKYIESMNAVAHSPNTTVVITPYDQKLIPMLPLPTGNRQ